MKLIVNKQALLFDASHGNPDKAPYVKIKKGTYEIQQIQNPYSHSHPHYVGDWYILLGTHTGMTIEAFEARKDLFEIVEE